MRNIKERMHRGGSNGVGAVAVVATIAGAIAGAAIVIAGTIALKNEKNRAKLKSVLDGVKSKVTNSGKDIDAVEKKIVKGNKKIIKKVKNVLVAKKS